MRQSGAGLLPLAPHLPTLPPNSHVTLTLHRRRGRCHGSGAAAIVEARLSSSPGVGGDWGGNCWPGNSWHHWSQAWIHWSQRQRLTEA
jgi:hypothetical protein